MFFPCSIWIPWDLHCVGSVSVCLGKMPRKIGFVVVSSSGHEDSYSAKELMVHAPTVNGWRSTRYFRDLLHDFRHFLCYAFRYKVSCQPITSILSACFCGRLCPYPQQVTLQLVDRSRVRKLQLLAHQYLISAKIEFHIGDSLPETHSSEHSGSLRRLG